jgi:hypothetical protein
MKNKVRHYGLHHQRLRYNYRERAFAEIWAKHNIAQSGINYGNGILQDLFIKDDGWGIMGRECFKSITPGQAKIVATVIQWLGSNCGQSFLWEVEARIKQLKEKEESQKYVPYKTWRCRNCRREIFGTTISQRVREHKAWCKGKD